MSLELTLWGRASSANVQKVLWALGELGLAYEHRLVGGPHGGLDDPHYRAMNPNGLVPTLQDGDLVLWESHAILRYLAATYGADMLWRDDVRERAIVDQWTDWTATTFQPAWISVFWLFVRTPPEHTIARRLRPPMPRPCRPCVSSTRIWRSGTIWRATA
nr:glutathione S-transferase [uncultured Devosia sp.]